MFDTIQEQRFEYAYYVKWGHEHKQLSQLYSIQDQHINSLIVKT